MRTQPKPKFRVGQVVTLRSNTAMQEYGRIVAYDGRSSGIHYLLNNCPIWLNEEELRPLTKVEATDEF